MNALFSIFLIRFLSNDDYGIYGFLISFLAVSLFITNFGFSGVIQKRIPLSSDSEKSGIFFKFIIIKGIAQLLFTVSIGLYLFLYGLFEFKLIILFSIFLFLGNLNNFILSNFFIINLQQKSSFYNLIFVSGIKIILLFCFNYFFSIGILQIFLIMAIAELLSFFISTFSWPAIKNRKKPSSKVLNEAKPFFLTKIIEIFFLPSIAIFFLTFFYDFSEVAKFKAATTIALVIIANSSLLQRFEFLIINIEKGNLMNEEEILSFKHSLFIMFAIISISIIGVMIIFSDLLNQLLFANKYNEAAAYLPIISLCILINHLSYLFSPHIFKWNKEKIFPKATLVASITYVSFCLVLIPDNSYVGAIIALCLGYISKPIFFTFLYFRELKFLLSKEIFLSILNCILHLTLVNYLIILINVNLLLDLLIFVTGLVLMLLSIKFFILKPNFLTEFKTKFEAIKLNE